MVFRNQPARQAMDQLRGEMNRLLGGFLENVGSPWMPNGHNQPAINVWEDDEALMAEMEVPGVTQDQLDISVAENELIVKLDRPETHDPHTTYHRRERATGPFTRVVPLPLPVDADGVTAQLHEGVLRIRLPKAASAKPRKIHVVTTPEK
jgi:HSP20 family protein